MKKFPRTLTEVVSVVQRSTSLTAARKNILDPKLAKNEAAKTFYKLYSNGENSFEEGFKEFYHDVKTGNYVFEGEIESISKFIRENMLSETIQDYKGLLDKHDFYYEMSDDRRQAQIGRDMEDRLRWTYLELTDDEKLSAAIMYRDKLVTMDYKRGSMYNTKIKQWNPVAQFDPNSFDGIFYKG